MPLFLFFAVVLMALPVVLPGIDLMVSSLFYVEGQGFALSHSAVLNALHIAASSGARGLGLLFAVMALLSRRKTLLLGSKSWLFLFFALIIGPGLVANVGFKDHWGRARPREVVEFGGSEAFSAALIPHFENARPNGSFVCGDGALGFFFPALAFVVSRKNARRAFWTGMGAGVALSSMRIVMGAHFLSDAVYASVFMLVTSSTIHSAMFGQVETAARWKLFFIPQAGPVLAAVPWFRRLLLRSGFGDKNASGKHVGQPEG